MRSGSWLPIALVLAALALAAGAVEAAEVEYVWVLEVDDLENWVIVERSNGEQWLLEYGVGCLSLWFYEGRQVIIYSPGFLFAGVGSKIVLPERDQTCQIFDAKQIGGSRIPLVPVLPPAPTQPASPPTNELAQPAVRSMAAFRVGGATYAKVSKGSRTIAVHAMDAAPFVEGGRTFVPVRYLAAAIGVASVEWDPAAQTVVLVSGNRKVGLIIGRKEIQVDGITMRIDVAPVVRRGRTYLPARYVPEAFGWEARWFGAQQAVVLIGP
ncbi:copper amine oxidase N-terminal domain-containing protein [Thermaerobacter sp. PB12/4term]|uniref:copper amine oxidase N-terminal domain-containing protein n=1 Tax=Thermaerobacter sp. PB12/4term TaxID=2293838 RepID=UPI000E325940|nr:copper amine oxidase N-terminal domain-containing protein [Thermaerobacter sp. PB12/4term]QIA27704.1 copper amine oxidase N-terminal domain-containing protein [Thermaerobacter sp. PB12/4term]